MKPIEEMTGLELREAVAVEVMGWQRHELIDATVEFPRCRWCGSTFYHGDPRDGWCFQGEPPAYESSIEAAFQVVEKMREKGFVFFYLSTVPCDESVRSKASFSQATPLGRRSPVTHDAIAETRQLAICRAALKAARAK